MSCAAPPSRSAKGLRTFRAASRTRQRSPPGALMDRLISWFFERKIECPSEDELVRVTGGAHLEDDVLGAYPVRKPIFRGIGLRS